MLDPVEGRKCGFEFRIAVDRVAQLLLARFQRRPDLRIKQSSQITVITFAVVLIAKQVIAGFACVLD
jgi:hypothetical protein